MENSPDNSRVEIIFIEDSPEDADLAMRSFEKYNLANEIKLIDDGQTALDYLLGPDSSLQTEGGVAPKLILLDLKLPKVGGLEILEKIKANNRLKRVPVVVMTSSSEDVDVRRAYALGANSYVVKPLNFNKFAEAIRQLGMYWLVLNQSYPII